MPKITMKQIADKAGVSLSTVSRVINNKGEVTEEMRTLVLHSMEELGYTPSHNAKKITSHSSSVPIKIGVLVTDIQNSSMGRLLSGIFSVTDNYDVEILVREYKFQDAKQRKSLEMFLRANVDGIISVDIDDAKLIPFYKQVVGQKLPLVIVSNTKTNIEHDGISVICNDTAEGAKTGYRYLQSLGHNRILLLGVPGDKKRFRYRVLAIKQELELTNQRLDESCLVDCENSYQGAYMAIDRLCKDGGFDYTAIFAMSDTMAYGAEEALRKNSMTVGKDVSVLGYDDLSSAEYMGLSSIAEPMFALGTNAAYMTMDLINRINTEPRRTVLQDSLQIRRSCQRRK